jgi:4'-phosphopantetheinyl transferase
MSPADRVHVWFADLACPAGQSQRWLATLSDEERARAHRFHLAVHRERFCATRVALRSILGTYVEHDPASLCFHMNGYGKPHLDPTSGGGIHFNVSHSDHLGMFAVSRERVVGADIERIRTLPNVEGLASRVFAPSEAAIVRTSPDPHHLFFQCWTRKEAFVKACGRGLTIPLDSFNVEPVQQGPVLMAWRGDQSRTMWTVVDVPAPANFVSALAVQGEACHVTSGWWPSSGDYERSADAGRSSTLLIHPDQRV